MSHRVAFTLRAIVVPNTKVAARATSQIHVTGASIISYHYRHTPATKRAMSSNAYSVIVLGSGQGATPLASAFAKAGQKTALVESAHIGGTCVNEGCTPTKTMVASGRVAHLVSRAADYGVRLPGGKWEVDMETVRRRKRDIVDSFRGGSERRVANVEGLDVLDGTARFAGPKEVEVQLRKDGEKVILTAGKIFVSVGCRPAPLKLPGVDDVEVLDSTSVMELGVVPERLIVVGGGYVGVEFAQLFKRLGAEVVILQRAGQLLGREDPDVASEVKQILEQDGLQIMLNASPVSVSKGASGKGVSLKVKTSDGETTTLEGSHLLSAGGRLPNTDILDVAKAGLETYGPGFLKANSRLETNVPGIYAMGDVKGGPQFTHISYDDFRIAQANYIESPPKTLTTDDRLVPYTVFMDPQLGRIGLSETDAQKIVRADPARKLRVTKMPMAYVARALETDESRGFMKVVVDGETKRILGAAVLGIEGGEIMSMFQICMLGSVTYEQLQNATFAHPCLSESLNNLWGFLEDVK